MKTIGILGGMGPRVTVLFEQMLVDRFSGGDQQIPTIVTINDGSIPDRSQFLLGRGQDPVPRLQDNIRRLELLQAEIIAIPCNSASTIPIFGRLESTATLLELPRLVVERALAISARRVCLLATEGTIKSRTYQDLCTAAGIECVVLSMSDRQKISAVISAVKSGANVRARAKARMALRQIRTLNVDAVILGCTELPVVEAQLVPVGVKSINSLAVLADACVEYSKGEKGAKRFIYA